LKERERERGDATEQCVSAGRKERMDQDQLGLHCICTDNCILYFGMEFILILYFGFNNCFTILAKYYTIKKSFLAIKIKEIISNKLK
jgi:hypothetical protein